MSHKLSIFALIIQIKVEAENKADTGNLSF